MKKLLVLISTTFGMSNQISLMATQLDCWVAIMSDQVSIFNLHSAIIILYKMKNIFRKCHFVS